MGFFGNAAARWATDAGDLSQQSYAAQQKQLEYRRALAQMMLNAQAPQGQMVGRQYVAPSTGASIATGLQQILGMYLAGRNSQVEGDLESKDKALRQAALKGMFAPPADAPTTESVRNQVVAAKDSEYRDMNASEMQRMQARLLAGGSHDATSTVPEGAQSFPVAPQPEITARPLPASPQAGAGRGLINPPLVAQPQTIKPEAALKQARSELLQDPAAAGLSVGEFNTRVQQRANQLSGVADRSAVAQAVAQRAAAESTPPTVDQKPEPVVDRPADAVAHPRLSYEDVLASHAVTDGSAQAAVNEQKQKFIDALKARSQAQQDSLLALGNGSDRSEKLQMALMEGQIKPAAEYTTTSTGDGRYVVTNKVTGDVKEGGVKGAPQVKPSDLNTYRKRESEIRGDIERVGNLKSSADKALELSKKLNINWAGGATWEKTWSALGMNPDFKQLEQVVTQQVLPQLTEMKGAASDRDLQTVFNTMPKPDANKAEFVRWYVDNQAKLQRAMKRLQGEYSAHQQDGASMGISPIDGSSSGSRPSADLEARYPKRGETLRPSN